jgi:hypothetical protein
MYMKQFSINTSGQSASRNEAESSSPSGLLQVQSCLGLGAGHRDLMRLFEQRQASQVAEESVAGMVIILSLFYSLQSLPHVYPALHVKIPLLVLNPLIDILSKVFNILSQIH